MGMLVLGIRFLCELAALAVLGWLGAHLAGAPLAIALPTAAAVLWGWWVAPRARHRLADPWRFGVESLVWAGAITSLVVLDRVPVAIGFGALAVVTAFGARRYEPPPP